MTIFHDNKRNSLEVFKSFSIQIIILLLGNEAFQINLFYSLQLQIKATS